MPIDEAQTVVPPVVVSTQEVTVSDSGPYRHTDHEGITKLRLPGDTFTTNIHRARELKMDGMVLPFEDDPTAEVVQPDTHPRAVVSTRTTTGTRGGKGVFASPGQRANPGTDAVANANPSALTSGDIS